MTVNSLEWCPFTLRPAEWHLSEAVSVRHGAPLPLDVGVNLVALDTLIARLGRATAPCKLAQYLVCEVLRCLRIGVPPGAEYWESSLQRVYVAAVTDPGDHSVRLGQDALNARRQAGQPDHAPTDPRPHWIHVRRASSMAFERWLEGTLVAELRWAASGYSLEGLSQKQRTRAVRVKSAQRELDYLDALLATLPTTDARRSAFAERRRRVTRRLERLKSKQVEPPMSSAERRRYYRLVDCVGTTEALRRIQAGDTSPEQPTAQGRSVVETLRQIAEGSKLP